MTRQETLTKAVKKLVQKVGPEDAINIVINEVAMTNDEKSEMVMLINIWEIKENPQPILSANKAIKEMFCGMGI